MTKTKAKSPPWENILNAVVEASRGGAKIITEPMTLSAFRQVVAELEEPEEGYTAFLMVKYNEEEKFWYVFCVQAHSKSQGSLLMLALPPQHRFTPFITKRHVQKTWRSLETIVRQFTDIFGQSRFLMVGFNWEHDHPI